MFIAPLLTTAKTCKQPKYLSVEEWGKRNKVYVDNGLLLGLKEEGNLTYATTLDCTLDELEDIVLCEMS